MRVGVEIAGVFVVAMSERWVGEYNDPNSVIESATTNQSRGGPQQDDDGSDHHDKLEHWNFFFKNQPTSVIDDQ